MLVALRILSPFWETSHTLPLEPLMHSLSSKPPFILPPYGPKKREEKDVFTIEKEEFEDLLTTLGHTGSLDTEGLWRLLKRSKREVVQALLYGSGVSVKPAPSS
jgi:hypothetical protein